MPEFASQSSLRRAAELPAGVLLADCAAAPGSAADLLCFDAIAREAEVTLYETRADGQLQAAAVRTGRMREQACGSAR